MSIYVCVYIYNGYIYPLFYCKQTICAMSDKSNSYFPYVIYSFVVMLFYQVKNFLKMFSKDFRQADSVSGKLPGPPYFSK